MSVVTEVTIPAEAFALAELFEAHEDARIEIERLASHSREWVMPAMWLVAPDPAAAARAIEADPAVEELDLIDVEADAAYAMIHWGDRVRTVVDAIVDRHGVVTAAAAAAGRWQLTLKFTRRDAVTDFQTFADEHDLGVVLRRLDTAPAATNRGYGLSDEQREVMEIALELGYFDVPRSAQLEDLAEALDISTNSASERLRRATRRLATNTIGTPPPTDR